MKAKILCGVIGLVSLTFLICPVVGLAQSKQQGQALMREGEEIKDKAKSSADLEKALKKFEDASAIFQKGRWEIDKGGALLWAGYVCENLGQHTKALAYYEQALQICEKLDYLSGKGITLFRIGGFYNGRGKYTKALEYYQQALQAYTKAGDERMKGNTLNNMGIVYERLGKHDKALELYKNGAEILLRKDVP